MGGDATPTCFVACKHGTGARKSAGDGCWDGMLGVGMGAQGTLAALVWVWV